MGALNRPPQGQPVETPHLGHKLKSLGLDSAAALALSRLIQVEIVGEAEDIIRPDRASKDICVLLSGVGGLYRVRCHRPRPSFAIAVTARRSFAHRSIRLAPAVAEGPVAFDLLELWIQGPELVTDALEG